MYTSIIAEISSNHMGDLSVAKEMIRTCAEAGADFVKFQSWQEKTLRPDWPDHDWYTKTELSDRDHVELIEECRKNNVTFLTTCFDRARIPFLASLGLKYIKVASTDIMSFSMLLEIREKFEHPIVSTGMAKPQEVEMACEILKAGDFSFLHCVSIYPTPIEKLNMGRMDWLKRFTPSVGLSDHSMGIDGARMAVARGAAFVEKHFTLDRNLPGKDHAISIVPEELRELCRFRDTVSKAFSEERVNPFDDELAVRERFVGRWGDNR